MAVTLSICLCTSNLFMFVMCAMYIYFKFYDLAVYLTIISFLQWFHSNVIRKQSSENTWFKSILSLIMLWSTKFEQYQENVPVFSTFKYSDNHINNINTLSANDFFTQTINEDLCMCSIFITIACILHKQTQI